MRETTDHTTPDPTPEPAPDPTMAMIERLVSYRRAAGLSQAEVGARIGTFRAYMSKMERGITSPRLTTLHDYARAVGARIVWRVEPITNEPGGAEPEQLDEPRSNDLARPCPACGHHTLYRPDGWIVGGPVECANPMCDSNFPAEPTGGER